MTVTDVVGVVAGCCSQVMSTLVHVLSCVSTLRNWGAPRSKYNIIIQDDTMSHIKYKKATMCHAQ